MIEAQEGPLLLQPLRNGEKEGERAEDSPCQGFVYVADSQWPPKIFAFHPAPRYSTGAQTGAYA